MGENRQIISELKRFFSGCKMIGEFVNFIGCLLSIPLRAHMHIIASMDFRGWGNATVNYLREK